MLTHLSHATVQDIITKANASTNAQTRHNPTGRISFSDPASIKNALAAANLPETVALNAAMSNLQPAQLQELAALTWLGRGDFRTWNDAQQHAANEGPSLTADYLTSKGPLGTYLEKGLAKL